MLWNTLFALSILGVVRFGVYITEECPLRNYACPTACDVDHKHYPRKECKDAKTLQAKEEGYQRVQKGDERAQRENWQEEVLIKGYKDGENKKASRPDTTTVQSIQQLYKKAVGTDKPEGL